MTHVLKANLLFYPNFHVNIIIEEIGKKRSEREAYLGEKRHFKDEHQVSLLHKENQWNLIEKHECIEITYFFLYLTELPDKNVISSITVQLI